jgi:hypothetical protein
MCRPERAGRRPPEWASARIAPPSLEEHVIMVANPGSGTPAGRRTLPALLALRAVTPRASSRGQGSGPQARRGGARAPSDRRAAERTGSPSTNVTFPPPPGGPGPRSRVSPPVEAIGADDSDPPAAEPVAHGRLGREVAAPRDGPSSSRSSSASLSLGPSHRCLWRHGAARSMPG